MGIKVIIERQVKKGKEGELLNLLRELRASALYRRGYISGETLHSHDDLSRYIVISNWQSLENWEEWRDHPDRTQISQKLDQILTMPEKHSVFHFVYL
ncbi:MAG: antibiotic biosynthesis monooxygenase [Deltaproteobacteria bacterium]|nr:MAG: antibiotic biosynthesis monooxygenase [Deltaproteobacteria bacterium]